MPRFEGRTVVVTGGNSGIGRAIAEAFVACGAHVVIGDVAGEPVAGAVYQETDVTRPDQVAALVDRALDHDGRLDVLVNNAGINGTLVPLVEQADETIDAVFAVNLKGVIYGLRYGLRAMVKQRGGAIVNIASVQGVRPIYAGASIYAASKAGVVSLTRSAAFEYGQYGIRVNAIAPGAIDTPMLRAVDPAGTIAGAVPMGRLGRGDELAKAVVWLSSDDASYVSAALMTVDGAFIAA